MKKNVSYMENLALYSVFCSEYMYQLVQLQGQAKK